MSARPFARSASCGPTSQTYRRSGYAGPCRRCGVLDFGDLTAGDPATDLSVAWMLLRGSARLRFLELTCGADGWLDPATWTRARAWALALGVACLANGATNRFASVAAATIDEAMLA
jgi:aminoglycoside phosphotransferase (APT) family kinase protein